MLVIAIPTGDGARGSREDGTDSGEETISALEGASLEVYTENLENRLAGMLSQVEGVGEVSVMITLSSTGEKVVEKDRESSSESAAGENQENERTSSSESTVYAGEQDTPYVSRELAPKIEGVAVIAQGGDDPVTVQNITEAVEALFGVEPHKIKVMKSSETK